MPVKVAVVGVGSMGINRLRVLSDFPGDQVHVVGVAEPDSRVLAPAVNRFLVTGYADYREMFVERKPDVVAVEVPTHLHYAISAHALDAGIHVLIEKPIAASIDDALTLVDLVKVRGTVLAVGHVERFNPAIIELKKRMDAGELGRTFSLYARRLGLFPPHGRDAGMILDLAPHDLDVMRYLTGAELTQVFAETQQRIHQSHEDLLLAVLRFGDDSIEVLDVNWLTPAKVRELSVTGERGLYQANYLTQDLHCFENDYTSTDWETLRSIAGVSEGTVTRLNVQKAEPLLMEYRNFLAAVRSEEQVRVTGEDGLAALRLAYDSLRPPAHRKLSHARRERACL